MTPKQAQFVREYLIDLNATQAAIRAGYSAQTASSQAERLLRNVEIAAAVKDAMDARAERTEVTADRVLEEFARIAFYDPSRVFSADDHGMPKIDYSAATEDDWRVVGEVSNETRREKGADGYPDAEIQKAKVKLHCKLTALGQIGKHLGMFIDRKDVRLSNLSNEELIALLTGAVGGSGEAGSSPSE